MVHSQGSQKLKLLKKKTITFFHKEELKNQTHTLYECECVCVCKSRKHSLLLALNFTCVLLVKDNCLVLSITHDLDQLS